MGNIVLLRVLLALIVAGCAIGVVRSRAERAEQTIRVAFLAGRDDEDYIGAEVFKRSVEAATGGRIEVQIFPSGQFCGSERECIEALQSGILDVHQTTFGGLAALFGAAQVLDLPYVFENDSDAECVMDGALPGQIGDAILEQGLGLRLMAVGNTGGWRSIATVDQRIVGVADLRGLRIRTLPSALEQQMVRELGGSPIALPFSELYTALSYGMLDGTKNSVQDVVGMKLHEHAKFLLIDRHSYMGAMWWFSEPRWRELPDELRPAVIAGFEHLKQATRVAAQRREAPALVEFARLGGTIDLATPAQRQELREATRGLRAWYVQRYGARWLESLDAELQRCTTR